MRRKTNEKQIFSIATDTFAYSMMLVETVTGDLPWGSATASNVDAALNVCNEQRPILDETSIDARVSQVIKACWAHAPQDRPSLKEVVRMLTLLTDQSIVCSPYEVDGEEEDDDDDDDDNGDDDDDDYDYDDVGDVGDVGDDENGGVAAGVYDSVSDLQGLGLGLSIEQPPVSRTAHQQTAPIYDDVDALASLL